jgi:protein-disulfide isomerase
MTPSQSGNPWFAISMGLMGLIVGYSLATSVAGPSSAQVAQAPTPAAPTPQQPPEPPPAGDVAPPDDSDHIRGNKDAQISVIEYSDFECPFCKRVHGTLQQLVDDYDGKVNWVYRHYPLGFHPNAEKASIATECAAELGGNDAFWAYTDLIFENQGTWTFEEYAKTVGLDAGKFNDCLNSDKYKQDVADEMAEGSEAGVRGTPGNLIYNNETGEAKVVSGAQPVENFKAVIDEMLGN